MDINLSLSPSLHSLALSPSLHSLAASDLQARVSFSSLSLARNNYNRTMGAPAGASSSSSSSSFKKRRNPSEADPQTKRSRCDARLISSSSSSSEVCKDFIATGTCPRGDHHCSYLHSWILSDSSSLHSPPPPLLELGHPNAAVTGLAVPSSGSDNSRLFSGGQDGTLRAWDRNSGKCVSVLHLGGPVGCMASEGPWLLVGIPGAVKAWNTLTGTHLTLDAIAGGQKLQVHALMEGNGILFAGTQDGQILSWSFPVDDQASAPQADASSFGSPGPSLVGHQGAVVSLIVGSGITRLYSGSIDTTIRVWDLTTLQCLQTLTDHTQPVTSLLCWDNYLFSGSLDRTIKAWAISEDHRNLEVIHTRTEDDGLLALHGVHDAHAKPVLLCSFSDNTLRLYSLPSFRLRGRIFSKQQVRAIASVPGEQFFTGDASSDLKIWKPYTRK